MTILPKRVVQEIDAYKHPQEGRYNCIRLDFNENTLGFPDHYPQGIPPVWINTYPEYEKLTKRLAAYFNIAPDSILLTNGSDEALSVIAHTFIEPGEDSAVISSPCFTMIPHSLRLAGAKLIEVPVLENLAFNLQGLKKALSSGIRIAVFASPENPTGSILDLQTIRTWCHSYPSILFVIDEAYGEFVGESLVAYTAQIENLLVTKTFSKAWGMAGLRLGIVFGKPYLIEYLKRVRLPYSVNSAAVWTALSLLKCSDQVTSYATEIITSKREVVSDLSKNLFKVDSGLANSFLLSLGFTAQQFTGFCKTQGLLIRNRTSEETSLNFCKQENKHAPAIKNQSHISPMWGKVRVSLGARNENKKFLQLLKSFCKQYGLIFDLDGTIVDTSQSFDRAIYEIVLRHSDKPITPEELTLLRQESGFNDDWVAAHELLWRRGISLPLEQIVSEGNTIYFKLARSNESLLVDSALLKSLKLRYPLFIVTGRTRAEYAAVWEKELSPIFEGVYCADDVLECRAKPAPDYLLQVVKDFKLFSGVYIGNAVDDILAAQNANLDHISVTTTLSSKTLQAAGAQMILSSINQLAEVFMI